MSNLLQDKYSREAFTKYVSEYLPGFRPTDSRVEARRGFSTVKQIGESAKLDLAVFEVTPESSIHARMEVSKYTYALLKTHPRAHALLAYHTADTDEWRLSLITTQVTRTAEGIKEAVSNPRRFSYVLGPKAKVNTPTKYLVSKGHIIDLKDLKERFSLEVVNKDFYHEISNLFSKLTGGTHTNGKVKKEYVAQLHLPSVPEGDQRNLEFAVRLIGRVIFCWFLREKRSEAGKSLMPQELLSYTAVNTNAEYYHSILEPIFFEVLNKHTNSRKTDFTAEPFSSVPYLNGGLFTPGTDDYFSYSETRQSANRSNLIVPDAWMKEFFSFLETYNFTIDENVSFDEELSIDPEMLGRIFENLLAEINPETKESARTSTGSFYTRREIVDHMVDKSLHVYLTEKTGIAPDKASAIISYDLSDDEEYVVSDGERQSIVDALEHLKLLDPACGSGAFPIGALQKIVFILQQIDPDAQLWFKKQFANASPELRRVIEREFSHSNFNYIRKLGVIRENIYGIDIQPIATEIARLRCFLTLIVDERIDDALENRGIEPLPNLDFKFVTANSLIGLPSAGGPTLFKDLAGITQLKEIRNQFFNSTNSERHQLKDEFKEVQKQMLLRTIQLKGSDDTTQLLSTWDPFSNKLTSWFDPEWMFGVEDKFDLVIGNPPYVKKEHLDEQTIENLEKTYVETVKGKEKHWSDDLYVHFIFRGLELVKPNGILTYITNDSFVGLASKERVRTLMFNNELKELIRCPSETFEATIYTAVFSLQKKPSATQSYLTGFFDYPTFEYRPLGPVTYGLALAMPGKRLMYASPFTELYQKLLRDKRVKDYLEILDTGIDSGNVRKKLFFAENFNGKLDRLIQGRQMNRWGIYWDAPNAKYKYCDIHYSPQAVKGIGRGGKQSKHDETWNFRGDIENHHQPERLLLRQTEDDLVVAYHNEVRDGRFYTDNTLFTILPKDKSVSLKYAMAVLNSRLLNTIYHLLSQEEGKTLAQVKVRLVDELPFRIGEQENIESIVEKILELSMSEGYLDDTNKQEKVREYENKIDQLVYKIYELNPGEIGLVENT